MSVLLQLMLIAFSTSSARPAPALVLHTNTACSAIAKADVERVLGTKVSEGLGHDNGVESTCEFMAPGALVTVSMQRLPNRLNLGAEIETLKAALAGSTIRDASESGTRAFFVDIAGAGTQIHIISEDHQYVMVSVLGFGEGERPSAAAATLARKILH